MMNEQRFSAYKFPWRAFRWLVAPLKVLAGAVLFVLCLLLLPVIFLFLLRFGLPLLGELLAFIGQLVFGALFDLGGWAARLAIEDRVEKWRERGRSRTPQSNWVSFREPCGR